MDEIKKVEPPKKKGMSFKERKISAINKMGNKAKAKEAFERVMRNK